MVLKPVFLAVLLGLFAMTRSASGSEWCATVNEGIPDNFLNVRSGPGVEYIIKDKLYPNDAIAMSGARCGLDEFGVTMCAGATSDWRFIERKLNPDLSLAAGEKYHGWVNSIYVTEQPCAQ